MKFYISLFIKSLSLFIIEYNIKLMTRVVLTQNAEFDVVNFCWQADFRLNFSWIWRKEERWRGEA